MKKLFTIPTWQVFLLLMAPAFFSSYTTIGIIIFATWGLILAFSTYTLGNILFERLPTGHDLNVRRFHFNLLFPVFYITIVFIVFDGGYDINQDNYKSFGWIAAVIVPLHLFSMYCIFYTIWFIAKAIATIENNRVVTFDNYAGNFFLLWFFPIGIWWMHPKVKRIILNEFNTMSQ
ncbi:MAG: hypothetical protein U9R46_04245 [Bacteroidota bacterium]|nr:hypothetical protein [Bacteroidota bacterium]